MKRAILLVVALLAIAGPANAVTLVSADGQPIGGKWQRWADASRVPTVAGQLVFSSDASACGAPACSVPAGYGAPPETWAASGPAADWFFYFELGHQFDWRYLTNPERRHLMRVWHMKWFRSSGERVRVIPHWDNSAQSAMYGGEDGAGAMFAGIYADCAEGIDNNNAGQGIVEPLGVLDQPAANPTINTCVYLDRLAKRVHADMACATLAPWHRSHAVGQFRWLDPVYRYCRVALVRSTY